MPKYWIAEETKSGFKVMGNRSHGYHKDIKMARVRQVVLEDKYYPKRFVVLKELS